MIFKRYCEPSPLRNTSATSEIKIGTLQLSRHTTTSLNTSQALLDLLTPWHVPGLTLERWGSAADGGYVVPADLLRKGEILITGGVGGNLDFEAEVEEKIPGIKILLFDHTVDSLPTRSPRSAIWYRSELGPGAQQTTLVQTLQLAEVNANHDVVLKLDIESAEWDLIAATPDESWDHVSLLILEIHHLESREAWKKYQTVLEQLDAHFLLIHAHGNNCSPTVHFKRQGVYVPTTMELTYINRRHIPKGVTPKRWNKPAPTSLDHANDPHHADLPLDYWIPQKNVFWNRLKKNARRAIRQLFKARS